jgi:hypothetical protein
MTAFERYIGIDYSGAETPSSSLPGLRAYMAHGEAIPAEVPPPPSPRWYWSRRGLAAWLVERLNESEPTLVGIDHGFSFPVAYFERHRLPHDWPAFLEDFKQHWPTDRDSMYVDFVREGLSGAGDGPARTGRPKWHRLTEMRVGAKSVFHFDVPGAVAKSTHAGLPWLSFIRQQVGAKVHFWPFDGWEIPDGRSVVAEVYPKLWSGGFAREDRTRDQHDAYSAARGLSQADRNGRLAEFWAPALTPSERRVADIEGWILGAP